MTENRVIKTFPILDLLRDVVDHEVLRHVDPVTLYSLSLTCSRFRMCKVDSISSLDIDPFLSRLDIGQTRLHLHRSFFLLYETAKSGYSDLFRFFVEEFHLK